MTSAIERLSRLVDSNDRHGIPPAELLPLQLAAANERLESQVRQIRLLGNRAQSGGITKLTEPADLVPLLFAHTAYKSYSEQWLNEGRWDRMGRWLETVSASPGAGLDADAVQDLDDWVKRLETIGHYVATSSGTTGKPAILSATQADVAFSARANVTAFSWATGIEPDGERRFLGLGPRLDAARSEAIREAMTAAFCRKHAPWHLPVPPITVGSIIEIVILRRKLAEGTARPAEVREFQAIAERRQAELNAAMRSAVDALVERRKQPFLAGAMFATLYALAEQVRAQGFGKDDFHSEHALLIGGGLKGAQLPPNYREYVLETLNVADERVYHLYSMQEINTPFPMCRAGRYHVAPWVIALPLDASGERLLDASTGEIEARAAFHDLSLEGRWGGVISGDRVTIDFRPCACGHQGPTLGRDITRYSDLPDGDKITCAGSIDAYVRGVA